jgi:S1-C subfamily serine protease
MRSLTVVGAARRPLRCALMLLIAPLAAPWGATAQEPIGSPPRDRADEVRLLFRSGRAELGVVLGGTERVDGRSGVRVLQVPPDRPAARAGIQEGDVLLSLNGTALGDEPGRRVTTLMRDVEPGDTVVVVLNREGSDHTVAVATERRRAIQLPEGVTFAPRVLRPGIDPGTAVGEALRELRLLPSQLGRYRLELVAMNPGLGRYFGADEGVLVANIATGSGLGLEPGDVILSIGGRDVRDPAHARSILASYRADEEAEFQVLRDRRRITVRGTPGEPR